MDKSVVTIRIEDEAISYFKQLAEEVNLPYQTLINLYLKDCVAQKRKPNIVGNKRSISAKMLQIL